MLGTNADIAAISIDQARTRFESLHRRFDAFFAALDCYSSPLSAAVPSSRLSTPFDVVSMQFCMHYAFEDERKARCMLRNVSGWLREGGVVVGTVPNGELLLLVPSFFSLSILLLSPMRWGNAD